MGRYVKRRRLPIEADMGEWAAKVGRSTRVLLGLERGESQGLNTVALVASALGVDAEVLFDILSSGSVGTDQQGAGYVAAPGVSAEQGVSNAELLAEIRRMRVDVEQIKRQIGGS